MDSVEARKTLADARTRVKANRWSWFGAGSKKAVSAAVREAMTVLDSAGWARETLLHRAVAGGFLCLRVVSSPDVVDTDLTAVYSTVDEPGATSTHAAQLRQSLMREQIEHLEAEHSQVIESMLTARMVAVSDDRETGETATAWVTTVDGHDVDEATTTAADMLSEYAAVLMRSGAGAFSYVLDDDPVLSLASLTRWSADVSACRDLAHEVMHGSYKPAVTAAASAILDRAVRYCEKWEEASVDDRTGSAAPVDVVSKAVGDATERLEVTGTDDAKLTLKGLEAAIYAV